MILLKFRSAMPCGCLAARPGHRWAPQTSTLARTIDTEGLRLVMAERGSSSPPAPGLLNKQVTDASMPLNGFGPHLAVQRGPVHQPGKSCRLACFVQKQ